MMRALNKYTFKKSLIQICVFYFLRRKKYNSARRKALNLKQGQRDKTNRNPPVNRVLSLSTTLSKRLFSKK